MDSALAGEADVDAYLDDCSCAGFDWHVCWKCTLQAMVKLVEMGLMLNMQKSKLLVDNFELLGLRVYLGHVGIAKKTIQGWVDLLIPCSQKELQGLLGHL